MLSIRGARAWAICLVLGIGTAACGGGPGRADAEDNPGTGQQPDPVVVDFPVAYIARPIPRQEQEIGLGDIRPIELLDPAAFNPGARLYLKDRATATAPSLSITDDLFEDDAPYDVKDLSAHPDGDRLLFALRAPELEGVDEREQPTWNIWEYDLRTDHLRRVIDSDIRAEAGHDVSPRYLPDGRIVFTSTRQTRSRALLLDDDKPQFDALVENANEPAFLLHVMEEDGTDIQQITYNQSHDLQPSVLQNGRILFTRWDGFNRDNLSLYTVNPDGTELSFHYGYHSLNGEQAPTLFRPEQMPDGRILAIYKPRDQLLGGDMLVIDSANYSENEVDLAGFAGGPAQDSLSVLPARIDGELSPNGHYSSAYPLHDGSDRLLVSWSPCRLELMDEQRLVPCTDDALSQTDNLLPAPPLYSLWVYNLANQTQQPLVVAREGFLYTEALALEPVPIPVHREPLPVDDRLAAQGVGALHIHSVYDLDGADSSERGIARLADPAQTAATERSARFLRLLKAVSTPEREVLNGQDDAIFGNRFNQNRGLLEILGYAPIEPDGSVMVRVPADRAVTFDIVDAQGARIGPRHLNWLQVRPGEVRHCQGCHSADSELPHGRLDAQLPKAYLGAPTSGESFNNTLRTDSFGTAEYPNMGETMAQFDARIAFTCTDIADPATCTPRGPRAPSLDLLYEDLWTDPQVRAPDDSFSYRYADLATDDYRELVLDENDQPQALELSTVHAPAPEACQSEWHSLCRAVINYENHIQPLWERPRWLTELDQNDQRQLVLDDDGEPINHTCTHCHSRADAAGLARIPPAQLELVSDAGGNGQMRSYLELLNTDVELEIVDDALTPRLIETGRYERDEDGELILDDTGTPVPIMTTVAVSPSMSRSGAASSRRFFNKFLTFDNDDLEAVDHRGMLNPNELRLLREWLDLNGRYYNNHFDRAGAD